MASGISNMSRHPVRAMRRVWRRRWQARWREVRPLATIVLVLAVYALGVVGYLQYRGAAPVHYDAFDALYRSILLFVFGGAVTPPLPATLQVARFAAPIITGSIAVTGIVSLSREQARLLGIRLLVGDHVVIAGLGATGSRLAFALNDSDTPVVVVERDPANEHLAGCRERGVTVLFGDAGDPTLLRKAGVGRAREIVVVCGNDGVNVDVAAAAARVPRTRRRVLTAFVHLGDLDLWRLVHEDAAVFRASRGLRLEFFNVRASGGRLLLDRDPPFPASAPIPRRPHVLVVGLDGAGEQVVLYMARLWAASNPTGDEQLWITLAGPTAEADLARLGERYPPLLRICALDARPGTIESASFQAGDAMVGSSGRCDVTRAYVFIESEADAMMAALALHARPDALHVPVTVAVNDVGAGVALVLATESGRFARVEPFGIMTAAVTPQLLLGGTGELFAQARHAGYVRNEQALGHTRESNPALAPWEELHENWKESNRRFADGIGATLEAAGCVLVPLAMRDDGTPAFEFTPEELESLARREHDRWMADLEADGWRFTPGEKDVDRKLHPLLVPWEQLTEEDREKDRDAIRELPAMIELTGFRVQRPNEDQSIEQATATQILEATPAAGAP